MKILGDEQYSYFKQIGLDQMEVPDEALAEINAVITENDGNVSDDDITQMYEAAKIPKYPVEITKGRGKGKTTIVKPKMTVNDDGIEAELVVTPEDVEGKFDYVADVTSMASGATEEMRQSNNRVLETILNPAVAQMLAQQGDIIKIKDLLISNFEQNGSKDAQRFFGKAEPPQPVQPSGNNVPGSGPTGGVPAPNPTGGMEGPPPPIPQGDAGGEMAPPSGLQG